MRAVRAHLVVLARLLVLAGAAAGCTGSDAADCRVGGDCASGVCLADGSCAPVDGDAAPPADAPASSDPDAGGCADNDGVIARDDVTFEAGRTATFRIALDTPVDTAGAAQGDGSFVWDWTGPLAGDHDVEVTTQAPAGAWWAGEFPSATYAARLSDEQDLLGVFEATPTALLLLGVVSPADGLSRTLLHHTPPVTVLSFPIERDATWNTNATVSGQASGFAATWSEDYVSTAGAIGTLITPYGGFPAIRVGTVLTRTVGFTPTTVRTFAFVAECYGVIGVVVSQDNEPAPLFTDGAELRRLAP